MNNKPTAKERLHLAKVKEQACSVCNAPGPSDAHHTKQGNQYTAVSLCRDCHMGQKNGWHGQRHVWNVCKMDENDALNETLRRVYGSN